MKKILCFLSILFVFNFAYAQEIEFKEYSYSEFFKLIEEEASDVFIFENAIIRFDASLDTLYQVVLTHDYTLNEEYKSTQKPLIIDKRIELTNVHFNSAIGIGKDIQLWGALTNIHFKQSVQLNQTEAVAFVNCIFDNKLDLVTKEVRKPKSSVFINILNNTFKKSVSVNLALENSDLGNVGNIQVHKNIFNNQLRDTDDINLLSFSGKTLVRASVKNNTFSGYDLVRYEFNQTVTTLFTNNKFERTPLEISIFGNVEKQEVEIIGNITDTPILINIEGLKNHFTIPFMQFNSGLYSISSYAEYITPILNSVDFFDFFPTAYSDSTFDLYSSKYIYEDKKTYDREMALLGSFYSFYKEKYAREDANAVFVKMKDMETKKLLESYQDSPSFKNLFSIRINQFLKIFSAYGTEPARAVIFSFYIILIFAFIYLFFPNSWDIHGKNRIIHRFTFFLKYMNRKQGIHEVYLEDKQDSFMEYAEYKSLIESSSNKIPGFFNAISLPFYRWAISGTRITASILSRIDVLKGSWEEIPSKDRWWKSLLLIGAFTVAILYDIIIKILNALMLSVNTFTTLGFGEIPIKGLPRYLAIIQGLIGWFMLTIFSVSLISQLLN